MFNESSNSRVTSEFDNSQTQVWLVSSAIQLVSISTFFCFLFISQVTGNEECGVEFVPLWTATASAQLVETLKLERRKAGYLSATGIAKHCQLYSTAAFYQCLWPSAVSDLLFILKSQSLYSVPLS
jgi:hypothetical protein